MGTDAERGTRRQFPRVCLGILDELLDCLGRHRRVYDQGVRIDSDDADRREVADRFEGEAPVNGLRDRVRVGASQEQRIAIGTCLRGGLRAGPAAGARQIFDDDGLPQFGSQRLGDKTGCDIGRSARRERHDDLDQPVGVGLCIGKIHAGQAETEGHDD